MRRITKINIFLAILVVGLAVIAFALPRTRPLEVASGWGDSGDGRESYTVKEIESGVLNDAITFNSANDGKIGDEKNFVGARLDNGINVGADGIWNGNEITVENGAVYLVRAYVHNNSPLGYDAVAENVKIAFNIPTDSDVSIPVHGFIFSDNASPDEYWDGVLFESNVPFHLEYIYGSALLENDGIGKNGGVALSDEIVTKAASNNGTLIGYSALNGEIPGGSQYGSYITIKVRVVFDSDYIVTVKVRQTGVIGSNSWSTQTTANVGEEVEFQMEYRNISQDTQENVMIKNILPSNLEYVVGSTKIYNTNYPDGAAVDQDDVVTTGINIGNYVPGANAYIRFTAKVVDASLENGSNALINWSQCGVSKVTLQDCATVYVNKN